MEQRHALRRDELCAARAAAHDARRGVDRWAALDALAAPKPARAIDRRTRREFTLGVLARTTIANNASVLEALLRVHAAKTGPPRLPRLELSKVCSVPFDAAEYVDVDSDSDSDAATCTPFCGWA